MRKAAQRSSPRPGGAVAGRHLPAPRPTGWAVLHVLLWLGLPLLALLLALDLLLLLVFRGLLGRCYGILCLLG